MQERLSSRVLELCVNVEYIYGYMQSSIPRIFSVATSFAFPVPALPPHLNRWGADIFFRFGRE